MKRKKKNDDEASIIHNPVDDQLTRLRYIRVLRPFIKICFVLKNSCHVCHVARPSLVFKVLFSGVVSGMAGGQYTPSAVPLATPPLNNKGSVPKMRNFTIPPSGHFGRLFF